MNVLILSCGTGGGHNAAGAAVQKQLQKQGHQVVMINPYQLKSNRLAGMIDKVYIGLVQKNSTLFGFVYRLGELYRRLPFPSPVYYINRKMAYILQEYLLRHPADVIITPHLYPAEIITNMKKMGMEVPPKGKHIFGMVKVGDKGQIVIPAKARKIFDIHCGDNLIILGDEGQGLAVIKETALLDMLKKRDE